ncbi:hypothetical protein REPUB_Repub20aG0035500 [Reevesia pubescens]
MRASSRQPVKRYKKLPSDIFPRNQDAEPNDRKIGKLCEYASRNPLRIPKITSNLEQRCFKDLRNESFGCVKVVFCIYMKLLSSCKEQMPLFASSLLGIIRTLLEQTRQDEIRIMGCNALVDFINGQMDGTHMFHLEGLIPKLCQLAQEEGDDDRALHLRSAGLQVLASMVSFMGEHSHISMGIDSIISVTLENYMDIQMTPVNGSKVNENGSSFPDSIKKASSLPNLLTNTDFDPTIWLFNRDTSKSPSYWSRVILRNIARLAKEATTILRVLEPLFHNFDAEHNWSQEKGVAFSVLMYLQLLMDETGKKSHLLSAILVKHMERKNVARQPHIQVNIVNVITQLAQNAKSQPSVAIIGTITDLMKHLRQCLHNSAELSSSGGDIDNYNTDLQLGIENCISQLSNKTSSHMALVRSFQLAFSLRSIALDQEVEDVRLQAVCVKSDVDSVVYGSKEDDIAALESLLAVELNDLHLKETVISHFMTKFEKLSEDELSSMKKQLIEGFSPDDSYPFGAPLFMETPRPCSPLAQMEFQAFEEIMPLATTTDEEAFLEANGSQSDRKTSLTISTLDVLSVNELLDSVC